MTLEEYREHIKSLEDSVAALTAELETIKKTDRVKAASARARLRSTALGKALKEFRKVSLEYSKQK